MEISNIDKQALKTISGKYISVHAELNSLEEQVLTILDKKNKLANDLNSLRESELNLINKIEDNNGSKLTQDILSEIIS